MMFWVVIGVIFVAIVVSTVRSVNKHWPRLVALWNWHRAIEKAGLDKQGVGTCGKCRHLDWRKNKNRGPRTTAMTNFCVYYDCQLYRNSDDDITPCKACNLGLIQLCEIPMEANDGNN